MEIKFLDVPVVNKLWSDVGSQLGLRHIYKRANQCLFGTWAAKLAAYMTAMSACFSNDFTGGAKAWCMY